jgi:cellulose biosynthesis protein BcsQ
VNRVERTVERRVGVAEIAKYFGTESVWSPDLPKRTVLQDAARRGRPVSDFRTRAARALAAGFRASADRPGARIVDP